METKNSSVELISAVTKMAGTIIGTLAVAVYFCGPEILPWYKK